MAEPELPPAAAATPQQQQRLGGPQTTSSPPAVPANTPASAVSGFAAAAAALRAAEEECSRPVPAAAVADAIQLAAVEEAERRASLGAAAVAGVGSTESSSAALPAPTAASPVPPSPYAATEYDGDDVVMMEIGELGCGGSRSSRAWIVVCQACVQGIKNVSTTRQMGAAQMLACIHGVYRRCSACSFAMPYLAPCFTCSALTASCHAVCRCYPAAHYRSPPTPSQQPLPAGGSVCCFCQPPSPGSFLTSTGI